MLERYFTNEEIGAVRELRNDTLEHFMTNREIYKESQVPANTERMWGFTVANNKEYSVTLDLNSDETRCLTFCRNYNDSPIEKTLIASQIDIEAAMRKYDEMSSCSALIKMKNWKNCLKEIEESNLKTQVLTEGYSGKRLKIGVVFQKDGKVIFNSIDVINKSYQPEEFKSLLKENKWEVEESRQPLTRIFDSLEKAVTTENVSTDNPIIKKILEGQENVTVAQGNGFDVKLCFKENCTLLGLHRDFDKCFKKYNIIWNQHDVDNAMKTFESLSQWPINRNCTEDIVKDLRSMDPENETERLLSIYEDTLFNRRISPEISLEQNKMYAQAVEVVINQNYAGTEVQDYLKLMKCAPHKPMTFDDFQCLDMGQLFQLRTEGYRNKLMEIQKEGRDTRKLIAQGNGQKIEVGTIYKNHGKVVLNTYSVRDEVYAAEDIKSLMEKKHWRLEDGTQNLTCPTPAISPEP